MKKLNKLLTLIIALLLIITTESAIAEDNWFDNFVKDRARNFDDAERHYYFGAQYSLRIPHSKDYLFSTQLPSVSFGCGGLDLNLGGLSYLKWDKIVQKGKQIMQNAATIGAGYLFQMGLNTVCPQCGTIWNKMEKFSDMLNSLYIDDCQAAEGIVVSTGKTIKAAYKKTAQLYESFMGKHDLNEADNKQDADADIESKAGQARIELIKKQYGLSDDDMNKIIGSLLKGNTTFLEQVSKYLKFDKLQKNILKGYFGDIKSVKSNNNQGHVNLQLVEPCSENNLETLIHDATIKVPNSSNSSGKCTDYNLRKSIYEYISDTIDKISDNIEKRKKIDKKDLKIIQKSGVPVIKILHDARAVGPVYMFDVKESIKPYVAAYYAIHIIKGLEYKIEKAIEQVATETEKLNSKGELSDIEQKLILYRRRVKEQEIKLEKELSSYLDRHNNLYEFINKIRKANYEALKMTKQILPMLYTYR